MHSGIQITTVSSLYRIFIFFIKLLIFRMEINILFFIFDSVISVCVLLLRFCSRITRVLFTALLEPWKVVPQSKCLPVLT